MSGVGSTNAMKKGSANNPFLAFSEADMKGYLNSAYTGCIVKYNGDSIARNLSDINKTVPEYAQNLVFNKDVPIVNWGCLKITTKSNGTETVQYLRTLFYNYQTKEISWETKASSGWVAFLAICNTQHPTTTLELAGIKILWVPALYAADSDNYPLYWPVTLGWQGENVDADGKVTLWGYGEDVSFVYLEDGGEVAYANMPCVLTPYIVGELYKVVYGDNEYYYEEFYYISEDKTTAGVEDVAPGKTFYDFAGTKQTGTGTRANPFLARSDSDMNAFNNATYLGKFIKYIGKTDNTYVKDAIYQVTNDATEYDRYMLLPALENEGTANDLASGRELINSNGEVVVGTATNPEGKLALDLFAKTITDINDVAGSVKSWPCYFYSMSPSSQAATFARGCVNLSRVNLPNVSDITFMPTYAFAGCTNLKYINVGNTFTRTGSYVFQACKSLRKIEGLSNVTRLGDFAFYGARFIQDSEFSKPKFTNLVILQTASTFGATHLFDIDDDVFPALQRLEGNYCFKYASNVTKISLTVLEQITGYQAFAGCTNLSEVNLPNVTFISSEVFDGCQELSKVTLPNCTIIRQSAFGGCYKLQDISLPICEDIGSSAFYRCSALSSLILPNVSNISNAAFRNCTSLMSLYILTSTVCSNGGNLFSQTHMLDSRVALPYEWGSIYVRASLLESYKTAANWSSVANRLVGLTDDEITALLSQ